jgi:predicted RecA/RadA family phage recombinase
MSELRGYNGRPQPRWWLKQAARFATARSPCEIDAWQVGGLCTHFAVGVAGVTPGQGLLPGDVVVCFLDNGGPMRAGVVATPAIAGDQYRCELSGEWSFRKRAGEEIVAGTIVYWDVPWRCATGEAIASRGKTRPAVGRVVRYAPADAKRVEVRLEPMKEGG